MKISMEKENREITFKEIIQIFFRYIFLYTFERKIEKLVREIIQIFFQSIFFYTFENRKISQRNYPNF